MPLLKSIVLAGSNNKGLVFSEVPSGHFIVVSIVTLPGSKDECPVELQNQVMLTAEQWSELAEVPPTGYSYGKVQLEVKSAEEINLEANKEMKAANGDECYQDEGIHYDKPDGPGCWCGHYSGKSFKAEPTPEPPDGTRTVELEDAEQNVAQGFKHADNCPAHPASKGINTTCDCVEIPF